jgi:hypothetical protein
MAVNALKNFHSPAGGGQRKDPTDGWEEFRRETWHRFRSRTTLADSKIASQGRFDEIMDIFADASMKFGYGPEEGR